MNSSEIWRYVKITAVCILAVSAVAVWLSALVAYGNFILGI